MTRFRITNHLDPNPPNGKRVTEPSRWGNPYRVGIEAFDASEAFELIRYYLKQNPELVTGRTGAVRFRVGHILPA